jgi:hypothetical protein
VHTERCVGSNHGAHGEFSLRASPGWIADKRRERAHPLAAPCCRRRLRYPYSALGYQHPPCAFAAEYCVPVSRVVLTPQWQPVVCGWPAVHVQRSPQLICSALWYSLSGTRPMHAVVCAFAVLALGLVLHLRGCDCMIKLYHEPDQERMMPAPPPTRFQQDRFADLSPPASEHTLPLCASFLPLETLRMHAWLSSGTQFRR